MSQLAPQVTRPPHPLLTRVMMSPINLPGQSRLDSGRTVDHIQAKAYLYQGPRNNCDHTRVLHSPCGTIQTSFRLDFISIDMYQRP
jgi:hypothetical protein